VYITTDTTRRNNSHQGKCVSARNIMHQHGTKKETNMEAHGGLKEMHEDNIVAQHQHGTKGTYGIKIEVERKQLDPMFTFH